MKDVRITRLLHLRRGRWSPLLLVCGYAALGLAWVLAMPPGAYPDADAHYIRAVAAGHGQFVGQPYTGPALDGSRFKLGQARVFTVPAGLAAPLTLACAGPLETPSICAYGAPGRQTVTSQISVEGTDSPLGYLLPGLLMRLARGPNGAELLGRIASLATSLGLLAVAVALLWSKSSRVPPYVGLVLAVTPTVLFLAGEIGPNGLEPMATICFLAGLIRLSRNDPSNPPRRWVFLATAAAAFVLALARPLGVAWVLLDVVCWAAVFGHRRLFRLFEGRGARIGATITVFGMGWARRGSCPTGSLPPVTLVPPSSWYPTSLTASRST